MIIQAHNILLLLAGMSLKRVNSSLFMHIIANLLNCFHCLSAKKDFQDLKKYIQLLHAHITIFLKLIEWNKCFRVTYRSTMQLSSKYI